MFCHLSSLFKNIINCRGTKRKGGEKTGKFDVLAVVWFALLTSVMVT